MGGVDIGAEYQRKKKDTVTSLISSPATVSLFLRETKVLQGKLKTCIQERRRGQREVSVKKTKNKQRKKKKKKRGQEVLFKASVQAERNQILPAQRLWLVGWRSEESQRVPGWSGW